MSYEWHAEYQLRTRERKDLQAVVDGTGRFAAVTDLYARLQLLAQSLDDGAYNTAARSRGGREARPGVRGKVEYQRLMLRAPDRPDQTVYTVSIQSLLKRYGALGWERPRLAEADLACLPEGSFFLHVPFALAAPYISKDDEPFYVHENPLRKDWVLRVPVVGSTSWKGSLRAALRWTLRTCDADPRVVRLLGNPKGEQEGFRRGRLSCFPTFFDALEVEVINPHSRETGAGKLPIHLEAVPKDGKGTFALLYTPMPPDDPAGPLPAWEDVLVDLELVGQASYALLAERGFGAKTASGMGRAEEGIPGAYLLANRWIEVPPELPSPPFSEPPPKVFQPDSRKFVDESGRWPHYETNEELEAHISGKKAQSQYKRQRTAYRTWLEQREKWAVWEQEVAALRERVERRMVRVELTCLGDLRDLRRRVEARMRGEHGGRDPA